MVKAPHRRGSQCQVGGDRPMVGVAFEGEQTELDLGKFHRHRAIHMPLLLPSRLRIAVIQELSSACRAG
jgi:hypothetical protein